MHTHAQTYAYGGAYIRNSQDVLVVNRNRNRNRNHLRHYHRPHRHHQHRHCCCRD